jgi:hypothetical protein
MMSLVRGKVGQEVREVRGEALPGRPRHAPAAPGLRVERPGS